MVLTRAGVFGFLDNNDLVPVHLTCHGNRGGQAGVTRGTAFNALKLGEQFGNEEDLALSDQLVFVHVAHTARGIARHISAIWPGGKRHTKTGVTGGERFFVEVGVRSHVQTTQVYRACYDAGFICAGCQKTTRGAG